MPTDNHPTPPAWAAARGSYKLDTAVDILYRQWRSGKQIVVLAGAGISVQSGFPAIGSLTANLLMTYGLQKRYLYLPKSGKESGSPPTDAIFSLERDGWSSPYLFPELYGMDQLKVIREIIIAKLGQEPIGESIYAEIEKGSISALNDFAKNALGYDWFNLLDLIADNRPELVEALFDALGANVQPGPAHNLLAQFVTWFNVRLVLTTNFDSLIETSLRSEAQVPYVFDVHVEAPPPSKNLVQKHLSIIKLHGSHYGIRADRTINTPLDDGHQATLLSYFRDDAVLVVLDYSGNDARFMGLMTDLMLQEGKKRTIIRVDAIASSKGSPFWELKKKMTQKDPTDERLIDLYYPHSRLFLLDVFQKCSGKLPNTRTQFSIIPHSPAPFKFDVTFGHVPAYESPSSSESDERRLPVPAWTVADALSGILKNEVSDKVGKGPVRFGVVTGNKGSGVSQFLSQVTELLFKTHQHLWCDLDQAISVGTLVAWLYDFVLNRQPDYPISPLPLNLPPVEVDDSDLGVKALARTVSALWNRLKRDRYLVIIDSISYALSDLIAGAHESGEPVMSRRLREAKRLLLFLSMLAWYANRAGDDSQCILLIGTHIPEETNLPLNLEDLIRVCQAAVTSEVDSGTQILFDLHPEAKAEEICPIIEMIIGKKSLKKSNLANTHGVRTAIGMEDTSCYISTVSEEARDILFQVCQKKEGSGEDRNYMRRLFVKVPYNEPDYVYIVKRDGTADILGDADRMLKDLLVDGNVKWAAENTDEEYVSNIQFVNFLAEASLCNRPRSWAQLLALPSVEKIGKGLAEDYPRNDGYGPNTRAVRALVNLSVQCGAFRVQPGAFYYMDGILRASLRDAIEKRTLDDGGVDVPDDLLSSHGVREVHRKMLRYYERVYNLSGDVTAINYFYYHTSQYLKSVDAGENLYLAGLEELGRGLLENSVQARGHLNAYDHAYLLLRLLKIIDEFNEKNNGDCKKLKKLIYGALNDLYDDADDSVSCEAINQKREKNEEFNDTNIVDLWHQKQKIHAQNLDMYRSCAAGMIGLHIASGGASGRGIQPLQLELDIQPLQPKLDIQLLQNLANQASGCILTVNEIQLVANAVISVCKAFADKKLRSELVKLNRSNPNSSFTIHRTIIRLARTVNRLYCFSGPRELNNQSSSSVQTFNLISAGKMLLASYADQDSSTTKLLWTRYHCTRVQTSLYSTTVDNYARDGFAKDLYSVGLAKSYAIRAGGVEGIGYEGFASLQEGEILLWEARMLMKQGQWPEALARQEAASRELAEARSRLVRGRASLVRWREFAILLASVSIDAVKLKFCQVQQQLGQQLEFDLGFLDASPIHNGNTAVLKTVVDSAERLERLGTQMIFLLPIVWDDDPWMEMRLWFELQRMVFYTWGTLAWAEHLCFYQWPKNQAPWTSEEQATLVTATNRCLRALRLIGGYDADIKTLPKAPSDDNFAKDWDGISVGLLLLWKRVYERVHKPNQIDDSTKKMEQSGIYSESIKKIQERASSLNERMLLNSDGNPVLKWKDIDKSEWLKTCTQQSNAYGHGDV